MPLKTTEHDVLSEAGVIFKKVFADLSTAAVDAELVVDLLYPGVSVLYNASAAAAAKISASWTATGKGSKAQAKSSANIQALAAEITPAFTSYAASQDLPAPTSAQITAWAQAFFALMATAPAAPASATASTQTSSTSKTKS